MVDRPPERPRILLVTRNLPPLLGGMERLNSRMAMGLHDWADVRVIGPMGCAAHLPDDIATVEVPVRPLWRFLFRSLMAGVRQALTFRPDLVIAGSGLAAPVARAAALASRARTAVYVHGLDVVARQVLYRTFWLPAIRACDVVVANSRNTRELAVERGVEADRIQIVNPGTDVPPLDGEARQRFRQRHDLGERPVLLSVGRLTGRKGLAEFVQNALPSILQARPDTLLVVIGGDAADALHQSGVSGRRHLDAVAARAGIAGSLRWLGICDDAALADAYQGADVHVFPVREVPGDVEGFGMVAIEAAVHGLPTVAFRVGGVPDAVIDGLTGALVAPDDHREFSLQTLRWLGGGDDARGRCRSSALRFSWDRFNRQVAAVLRSEPGVAS
jgi:phosphatidylinositol alpha-1,6-mannosyltransferase